VRAERSVQISPLDPHSATAVELQERIEADRRGAPYLVFRDEDVRQRIVALDEVQRMTVGRVDACDVCLSWDAGVSRVHAELERLAGDWAVVDDGLSRNGTFVNGERLAGRRRLADGDALTFGDTIVVYRAPAEAVAETAPATGARAAVALSPAQRRVLVALCRPFGAAAPHATPATNRQIADELVLSVEAVKTHLRSLFDKFAVEDLPHNQKRARLVELALQSGTITARDL
jgi:predicted component of type VI protein secretion system